MQPATMRMRILAPPAPQTCAPSRYCICFPNHAEKMAAFAEPRRIFNVLGSMDGGVVLRGPEVGSRFLSESCGDAALQVGNLLGRLALVKLD